jgi:ABC-type phosphate/phosphonate transport system substrate-binding protein
MCRNGKRYGVRAVLVLGLLACAPGYGMAQERSEPPECLRIGLVETLFDGVPRSMITALSQPFSALIRSQTGFGGELVPVATPSDLGRQLADNKIQLGVFHGVEFAWTRQKHPELKPLVLAVNVDRYPRAYLLVRKADRPHDFAELAGTKLAVARQTRQHCRLWVEHRCEECGKDSQHFFAKVNVPPNAEEALDDVVDGLVQSAVVDGPSLDCYKRRKPGRYAKLDVLHRSEGFPAAVVAYRPGAFGEADIDRFRDGLMNAKETALGRQLLLLWRLTAFEPVPSDYEQALTDIVKTYPGPRAEKQQLSGGGE